MTSKELLDGLNEDFNREVHAMLSYLHKSFLVFGPNRQEVIQFFRSEATESMQHAILLGEKIIALGGLPNIESQSIRGEPKSIPELLKESREIEVAALEGYKARLEQAGNDIALRVLLEGQVAAEQEHMEELDKYIRE